MCILPNATLFIYLKFTKNFQGIMCVASSGQTLFYLLVNVMRMDLVVNIHFDFLM